jgi:hypothetical protein
MSHARQTVESPAQRLWVLERLEASRSQATEICRFVGAIAILDDSSVCIAFIKSLASPRASESVLRDGTLRLNLRRDASRFPTLDDAVAWADTMKQRWLGRGWTELCGDRLEAETTHVRADVSPRGLRRGAI